MTDWKESTHIGAPPLGPPIFLDPPRPKKRKRRLRWEVPITVAIVGVILAIGASAVGFLTAPSAHPTSAPTKSGRAVLTESAACAAIVPPATDGLKELTAVFKNPDRDTAALLAIAAELRAVEPITPESLRQDLVVVDLAFEGVGGAHGDRGRIAAVATGDSGDWSDAVSRIIARCRQYAAP